MQPLVGGSSGYSASRHSVNINIYSEAGLPSLPGLFDDTKRVAQRHVVFFFSSSSTLEYICIRRCEMV